ncbi:hypothetical protein Tco_0587630 [Tanacetum coccineum]
MNLFAPESDETIRLAKESRSKLCKAKVKPYDYTKKNSLYELFTPQTEKSREQLFFSNEVKRNIFRKSFQKQITHLVKRIEYLPTKASMSKSKKVFDHLMINIENIRSVVELNWKSHLQNEWQNSITHDVKLLVKDMLIPLAQDTKSNASLFETHLKIEMFAYFKYVQSLKKEVDELQYDKTELLKEYDLLLQECVSKDIMCAILHSFDNIDEQTEMQFTQQIFSSKWKQANPRVSTSTGVIHRTSISRPQLRSTQMKEKVMPNNNQVKIKKKEFINDVNARTKKPKVVPISTRKPTRQSNQSVATPHKKIVASKSTIQKSKSYFRMLYENTNIMDEVDIEDLTIEQHLRLTQESQTPKKIEDMTIAEYLEYEKKVNENHISNTKSYLPIYFGKSTPTHDPIQEFAYYFDPNQPDAESDCDSKDMEEEIEPTMK